MKSRSFKMSLSLPMPKKRPKSAPVCGKCGRKHNTDKGCDTGVSAAGELKLPKFDGSEDGTEMIDKGMK